MENLKCILALNISYMDLRWIWTYLDYFSHLEKNLYAMIWYLGPPTFFASFRSVEHICESLVYAFQKMH